ncbi:MAG TPA: phosphodiesterase [Casimicrobiaceae bacterium]|nr:phosphodiesterase [Casimicrobiaceae bacterium]
MLADVLICQLSDLHVRRPGELAYRRVDTESYVRRCVSDIARLEPRPDAIVITGDLVDRGSEEEYAHARTLLAPLAVPIYVIPGNHDDRAALRRAFPDAAPVDDGAGFVQYATSVGPMRLIALDTLLPGEGGGRLCEARLAWLEEALVYASPAPVVILMHHPPFATGIEYMDVVGLETAHPLEPIIRRHPNVERILCGHVHRTIVQRFGGTLAVTCPSPAHQVALDFAAGAPASFVMEPPGYLLHRWSEGEGFTTYAAVLGDYDGPYRFYEPGATPG